MHFGEVWSSPILSGGIFEHLVHSAHFLNFGEKGRTTKNYMMIDFFVK